MKAIRFMATEEVVFYFLFNVYLLTHFNIFHNT